jgi:hypothetical protein
MNEVPINWAALAIAVFVKQAIGAFWYSPAAFGRKWSAVTGIGAEDMRRRLPRVFPIEIVATVVMAYVLVHAVRHASAYGALSGGGVGLTAWLGFVSVSALNGVLYARGPLALYAIDMGYWLVVLVVMGAILGVGW